MACLAVPDAHDLNRLWSSILGRAELEVDPHVYRTWLKGTRAVAFAESVMRVEAATPFACDWLNQRLQPLLARVARELAGGEVVFDFFPRGIAHDDRELALSEAAATLRRGPGALLGRRRGDYTFDRYHVAAANRVAWCSTVALVRETDCRISPVVLWGAPGVGKTHLLHAMAGEAQEAGLNVACLTAEEFINRYMRALRANAVEEFHATIRGVGLLIIDDLQFLRGKRGVLDELVHTIDAVTDCGGAVAVASEQHPDELGLPDRLRTRLDAGIVAHLTALDASARRELAAERARERQTPLPDWALDRIASIEVDSVRTLEGAVNTAILLARADALDAGRLDAALARIAVNGVATSTALTPRLVLETVGRHFDTCADELAGRSRKAEHTIARAAVAAVLKQRGHSLSAIGEILGGRDKATISGLVDRGRAVVEGDLRLQQLAG
jgi:chromosomal replication initiator protein